MHQKLLYCVVFAFVLLAFCEIRYHYYLSLILCKIWLQHPESCYILIFVLLVRLLNMQLKDQIVKIIQYHSTSFIKESEVSLKAKRLKVHSFCKCIHPLILKSRQLFHWQHPLLNQLCNRSLSPFLFQFFLLLIKKKYKLLLG